MWTRTVNGRPLHFYLAGINNQNFLMRDKETGSWWQQITGKAIYGPLRGAVLQLVLSDELTFDEWRREFPDGKVLAPVAKYTKEYDPNWEPETAKYPVVISFPGTELKSRDVVVGLEMDGPGRAYPWDTLTKQSPIMDRVNGTPLLIAVGSDGKSFRVFVSRVDGKDTEFFLKGEAESDSPGEKKTETPAVAPATVAEANGIAAKIPPTAKPKTPALTAPSTVNQSSATSDSKAASVAAVPAAVPVVVKPWILLDSTTASEWNFQGCAISGPSLGKCLDRVPSLKDYWFDWRNYHPNTTVYKR